MPLILGTNSIKDTGYEVANSLRFDGASSAYLNKTFGSSGNRKTFTLSFWIKKCVSKDHGQSDGMMILGGQQDSYPGFVCFFNRSTDTFVFRDAQASNNVKFDVRTDAKFRDFSAWTHIVVAMDTTQGTASNRIKVYINGTQTTDLNGNASSGGATDDPLYPDQDFDSQFNGNEAHFINKYATNYEDMYLAEYCFIDGQQLDPTSFGEFDSDSPNIWKPIDVSGLTFGTNGFHLDFENASSLGADVSGNSNNFTVNNLTSVDQSTDTCTNNFATFNGVLGYNSTIVLAEGNLKGTTGSTHQALYGSIFSSIGVTQGAWYAEFKVTTNSNHSIVGISADLESDANGSSGGAYNFIYLGQGIGYYGSNGKIFHTSSDFQMTYGSAVSNNDIVGVALDVDNQEVYFSINGVFQNSGNPESGASKTGGVVNEGARNIFSTGTGTLFFAVADFDATATCAIEANFGGGSVSAISSGNSDANGHGNFSYAVPSGYFSLCTKNLAEFG